MFYRAWLWTRDMTRNAASSPLWNRIWTAVTSWRGFEASVAVIAIILAAVAAFYSYNANKLSRNANNLSREANEHARIVSAWEILMQPAPGNSGKKDAIETLIEGDQTLSRIDMSCARHAGGGVISTQEDDTFFCPRRKEVWLQKMNAAGADLSFADLSDVDLSEADLSDANLRGAYLSDANLRGAYLREANLLAADLRDVNLRRAYLRDAKLQGANLSNADLWLADLSDAELFDTDLSKAQLVSVNVSATNFCGTFLDLSKCARNLTQVQVNSAWAWSDQMPIFETNDAKLNLQSPPLCDPSLRLDYEANDLRGRPEGC